MSWRAGRRALAWGPWPLGLPSRMPTSGGCVLHLLHPCDCNRQVSAFSGQSAGRASAVSRWRRSTPFSRPVSQARSIYAEVSVNTKDANEGSEGQGKEKTSARNTRAAKAAVQHLMQITDRVNLRRATCLYMLSCTRSLHGACCRSQCARPRAPAPEKMRRRPCRGELRARRQRIEPCEARNAYREDVAFQHMKDRLHKLRGWVIRRDVREASALRHDSATAGPTGISER